MAELQLRLPIGPLQALHWGRPGDTPVLALHGWLDNAASFVPIAPHLAGIELVAIDLPGHGRSAHLPVGTCYTYEIAVHHVLDAADTLGWARFSLLGHSMGAGLASLVAAACPERIERLVCIEALGGLADDEANTAQRMRESIAASRSLRSKALRVFPDPEPAIRARVAANQLTEASARLLVERGIRRVPGGWEWSSDQRLTVPTFLRQTQAQIEATVAGITCPTAVVFAEPAQPYLPDAVRHRFVECLGDGRLHVLDGGHHLHMEQPGEVAACIAGFLRGED
ncbi:MAG: alpha/beta hydrolase [Pseudoxanthomonas suwonensis]|nr:alpha/beta hydrolase [Pseudoxanthomonas suwonensis]